MRPVRRRTRPQVGASCRAATSLRGTCRGLDSRLREPGGWLESSASTRSHSRAPARRQGCGTRCESGRVTVRSSTASERIMASPLARKLAEEHGLSWHQSLEPAPVADHRG